MLSLNFTVEFYEKINNTESLRPQAESGRKASGKRAYEQVGSVRVLQTELLSPSESCRLRSSGPKALNYGREGERETYQCV